MDNSGVKSVFFVGGEFEKLLFETAITYARAGFRIWYISFFPFERIPENIIIPERDVLNLITFIYLKEYKSLISHLNGIHLWQKPPRIILVSGFGKYSGIDEENYDPICGALIATSLLDACSTASKKLNAVTYLVVTCEDLRNHAARLNTLRNLYFWKMYHHIDHHEMVKLISEMEIK